MNPRLLVVFLSLSTLTGGCIIETTPDDDCGGDCGGGGTYTPPVRSAQPGDVELAWSFEGLRCGAVTELQGVRVSIPGERLHNDGFFPCQLDGVAGVVLHDFAPGSYSFGIEAVGWDGRTYYVGSGRFVVDGDVYVEVDLDAVQAPVSHASLSWSFPEVDGYAYPTCRQAGIAWVDVRIDEGAWQRLPCDVGQSATGARTPDLYPGTHALELVAVDSGGYAFFSFSGTLTTFAARPAWADYHLQWAVGGVRLAWQLKSASGSTLTCTQAGVQTVAVNFQDSYGQWLYGSGSDASTWDLQPCSGTPIRYDYLPPGTWSVFMQAQGASYTDYLSSARYPPTVTVTAGEWPTGVVNVPLVEAP